MKRTVLLLVAIVAVAVTGAGAVAGVDLLVYRGRIYPNVEVAGVAVGGLVPSEARVLLRARLGPRLLRPLALRAGSERWSVVPIDLGARFDLNRAVADALAVARTGSFGDRLRARWDLRARVAAIAPRVSLEPDAGRAYLKAIANAVQQTPRPARLSVERGGVVIVPSHDGIRLDLAETAARIEQAIRDGSVEVEAAAEVRRPRFTTEDARALGITAPVASYSTWVLGNANRLYNITLAASRLRGTILAPGDVLSYNRIVGNRTAKTGFRVAPVLLDDELVPGDGGGVCQVSSTLFNVALLSDMQVLERANHSRPVAYLPIGRDATVVFGAIDLRARNTSGGPLLLWAEVRGRLLTISAYGRPAPGRQVRVLTTGLARLEPPEGTVTRRDPRLPVGQTKEIQAAPGYRVTTIRQVYAAGSLVRSEVVASSLYRPVPHTIKIGSAPLAEVQSP